jgi:hypothetical protein
MIVVASGTIFYACQKENKEVEKQETSTIKQQKKPTGAELLAAVASRGVKLEAGQTYTIQYRSGFFYSTTTTILWGLYKYTSTGCKPGDGICDIVHVWEKGGRLILSPPPRIGLDAKGKITLEGISDYTKEGFEGYLCVFPKNVFSNKKIVAFISDITKTTYPEWYTSDILHLKRPFAIEPILCYESGIPPKNQIVPAGNYPLYKEGNVCLWYIEIDE